ncbi:MAG: carbon-nitrogen family hydrolase [Verrucomicrobiaceae bacterium]|nr:carbon-nitrogen family hydrolase [Verrucomicrobiaceae bacterium]
MSQLIVTPTSSMQLHLFQTDIHWENPEANRDWLATGIEQLQPAPGDLLILPEMYATGFSMDVHKTAEEPGGNQPNTDFLMQNARTTGCCIIGGVATKSATRFHNEAIAAFPDGGTSRYKKHQPFTAGGESEIFSAGDELMVLDWQQWCVGLTICYDLRFPEIYRSLALGGAELLVNIANWPRRRINHWVTLLKARAIENQCYVAGVNRVGEDPDNHYPGRSLVVDPHGKIIADAGDKAGVTSVAIDLKDLRSWRREFPALEDIRHDASLPVTKGR